MLESDGALAKVSGMAAGRNKGQQGAAMRSPRAATAEPKKKSFFGKVNGVMTKPFKQANKAVKAVL